MTHISFSLKPENLGYVVGYQRILLFYLKKKIVLLIILFCYIFLVQL
jgi:hypothetical protein